MTTDVKALQQLVEASGGATTMDWSTISHTHGGGTAVAVQGASGDIRETMELTVNLVKQLQQLPQAAGATTDEWSTISHTHGGPK